MRKKRKINSVFDHCQTVVTEKAAPSVSSLMALNNTQIFGWRHAAVLSCWEPFLHCLMLYLYTCSVSLYEIYITHH